MYLFHLMMEEKWWAIQEEIMMVHVDRDTLWNHWMFSVHHSKSLTLLVHSNLTISESRVLPKEKLRSKSWEFWTTPQTWNSQYSDSCWLPLKAWSEEKKNLITMCSYFPYQKFQCYNFFPVNRFLWLAWSYNLLLHHCLLFTTSLEFLKEIWMSTCTEVPWRPPNTHTETYMHVCMCIYVQK